MQPNIIDKEKNKHPSDLVGPGMFRPFENKIYDPLTGLPPLSSNNNTIVLPSARFDPFTPFHTSQKQEFAPDER